MINPEFYPYLQAPPRRILVQRLEMPTRRGLIHIPSTFNMATRSNEAIILSVGEGSFAYPWLVDDLVFLSPSVSRYFELSNGRTIYLCSEGEILAKITRREGITRNVELDTNASYLMKSTGAALESPTHQSVTEGDSRGLQ